MKRKRKIETLFGKITATEEKLIALKEELRAELNKEILDACGDDIGKLMQFIENMNKPVVLEEKGAERVESDDKLEELEKLRNIS
ncbi:MAG: hypothetical protein FWG65_13400 [Turicibacter sp.]|nr:hypothetical protein [Turicibacter sp.]